MVRARRSLKTVTGVSGGADVYAAAVDPARSTLDTAIEIARLAEEHRIDALFAADLLSFGAQGAIGAQEPLIFLAALAGVTRRAGLIATVTTTFHHPYNLARLFGTLDHVSNGRAAWNAVTSSLCEENYGAGERRRRAGSPPSATRTPTWRRAGRGWRTCSAAASTSPSCRSTARCRSRCSPTSPR